MAQIDISEQELIEVCSVDAIRGSDGALIEENWEESGGYQEHRSILNPNWLAYYQLEEKNMLLTLVVRIPTQGVVGYSVTVISSHQHYSDLIVANNDVLFVSKKWRMTGIGPRLVAATEAEAGERGAKLMLWHAKPSSSLSSMMSRLEYDVAETIYSREL